MKSTSSMRTKLKANVPRLASSMRTKENKSSPALLPNARFENSVSANIGGCMKTNCFTLVKSELQLPRKGDGGLYKSAESILRFCNGPLHDIYIHIYIYIYAFVYEYLNTHVCFYLFNITMSFVWGSLASIIY